MELLETQHEEGGGARQPQQTRRGTQYDLYRWETVGFHAESPKDRASGSICANIWYEGAGRWFRKEGSQCRAEELGKKRRRTTAEHAEDGEDVDGWEWGGMQGRASRIRQGGSSRARL